MRLLYLRYPQSSPISQKPSQQLSWSHYVELLKIDDELERGFYERRLPSAGRSELKRQKAASLFLRLAASQPYQVSETQLETLLCDHLQPFLLELGKGFTFVGRQYRVTIYNNLGSIPATTFKVNNR